MKSSNWPDFLLKVGVRLVSGFILGGLACFLMFWRHILSLAAHGRHPTVPILLLICACVGAIVAVLTIPRWQTPWYKCDHLDLSGLLEPGTEGSTNSKPGQAVIKKSVSIKLVGADGVERAYSSIDEVPHEVRSQIESSMREAEQAEVPEVSSVTTAKGRNGLTVSLRQEKRVSVVQPGDASVWKITDPSGSERIYHSLDEMPADIRAAVEHVPGGGRTDGSRA